jgi:hypothetical protein
VHSEEDRSILLELESWSRWHLEVREWLKRRASFEEKNARRATPRHSGSTLKLRNFFQVSPPLSPSSFPQLFARNKSAAKMSDSSAPPLIESIVVKPVDGSYQPTASLKNISGQHPFEISHARF